MNHFVSIAGLSILLFSLRHRYKYSPKLFSESQTTTKSVKVYLVGAGPGSDDLITMRGLNILSKADIVLVDRLVSPKLFTYCKNDCKIINVGKNSDKERFSQKELEKELIQSALSLNNNGGIVVRLKGGDPFVFGLGSSEIQALEKANIDWEYVPGLSSASALPGLSLNIPLTHKGISSGYIVLSGHAAPTITSEWAQLPKVSEPLLTLVVLMCAKNLSAISDFLMKDMNWNPSLPCALVHSGSTEDEIVLKSSLLNVATEAKEMNMDEAPLILVVGNACNVFPLNQKNLKNPQIKQSAWGSFRPNSEKIQKTMDDDSKITNKNQDEEWWVFGYGSLIWKPDLPHTEAYDGFINGFVRRFWQNSPDHRGTPSSPGRVCTIVSIEDAVKVSPDVQNEPVFGKVFRVESSSIEQTRNQLFEREKAGYDEKVVDVHLQDGRVIQASVFVAHPDNEFFHVESTEEIAKKIYDSKGPSGKNLEYFERLYQALVEMRHRWGDNIETIDSHLRDLHNSISKLTTLESEFLIVS